ncbi:hypothetical protein CYJ96_08515 [Moraxella osloensis]|uniref:Uncharacterized protein n=1 Tax=Faucicola osloensis TaxID=34062 RepID=A0A2I1RH28_FAUOS|nr:hypothetical protein CYJ96_08515 [Moraxella osloensis]
MGNSARLPFIEWLSGSPGDIVNLADNRKNKVPYYKRIFTQVKQKLLNLALSYNFRVKKPEKENLSKIS